VVGLCVRFFFPFRCYLIKWFRKNTLQSEGFDDEAALDEKIKKLESDLKKARKKDLAEGDDGGVRNV
jgi:hypothetical protein